MQFSSVESPRTLPIIGRWTTLTAGSSPVRYTFGLPNKSQHSRRSLYAGYVLTSCSTSLVNLSIYYLNPCKPMYPFARIVLTLLYSTYEIGHWINFPGLPSRERLLLCTHTRAFEYPQNTDNDLVRYALITITQILQNLSSLKRLTLIISLGSHASRLVPSC